jgi:hypothetical protein
MHERARSYRAQLRRWSGNLHRAVGRQVIQLRLLLALAVLRLISIVATEPDGRAYHRLIMLGWMVAQLLVLGCVLGVVWRIQWPQLPELPVPVTMF